MPGSKLGKADGLRAAAPDEIEHQLISAGRSDLNCEQRRFVGDFADLIRLAGRNDISALILTEQYCRRVWDLGDEGHFHSDIARERHLRDRNRSATIRAIVYSGDKAASNQ